MEVKLKKQKIKGFTFYEACKCPNCEHIRDGFNYKGSKLYCPKCNKAFDKKELELAIIGAFVCICGGTIPPLLEYRVSNGYQCISCQNVIES